MTFELVTIAEAALYCRVDNDEEDSVLAMLISAATAAVLDVADGWLPIEGEPVPDRIKLAILAHVAQAFDQRHDGVDLPASAARLTRPMRRLTV